MGRNEQDLVRWIASHTLYETYDQIGDGDLEQINAIIRHFNVVIHEAKHTTKRVNL